MIGTLGVIWGHSWLIWRSQYGVKAVGDGGDCLARNDDYWQTPKIHNFARLNYLLYETQVEHSRMEPKLLIGALGGPYKRARASKDPLEAQNGYEYKKIVKMNRINYHGPFLADSTFKW